MNITDEYKILEEFIESLIEIPEWKKVKLNIEVQPNVIGLNGDLVTDLKTISLKTKPNEAVKEAIKNLHLKTATNATNKWNKLIFTIYSNGSNSKEFIWDQVNEDELKHIEKEIQLKDSAYNPPKWP